MADMVKRALAPPTTTTTNKHQVLENKPRTSFQQAVGFGHFCIVKHGISEEGGAEGLMQKSLNMHFTPLNNPCLSTVFHCAKVSQTNGMLKTRPRLLLGALGSQALPQILFLVVLFWSKYQSRSVSMI